MKIPEKKDTLSDTYTESFFRQHERNLDVYEKLSKAIVNLVAGGRIRSLADVGCGHGLLVESLRKEGVQQLFGLDGSESARAVWNQDHMDDYAIADLTAPETAERMPLTEVVCSFEVGEHLPADKADTFIRILTGRSPQLVVFSAATPWQDKGQNPTHVNEQSLSYWVERFGKQGYGLDMPKTIVFRNAMFDDVATFVKAWWYPKNALVFRPSAGQGDRGQGLENIPIKWFPGVLTKDPIIHLVMERDKFEYLYLIEKWAHAG